MIYTQEQQDRFRREQLQVVARLLELNFQGLYQSQQVGDDDVKKYLTHGVGRRLDVIKRCLEEVFRLFPLDQERVLRRDVLADVQIYLHAFVINVYGVFDNWAWAFLYRHGLIAEVGDRRNVGLFKRETQRCFPCSLTEHLTSAEIAGWHRDYLTNYRDALAHRIALYIPPWSQTEADAETYQRLETEKTRLIQEQEWDRLNAVWDEQDQIGAPCPVFMHEYSADANARPVYLHPQMICDGLTVVDFGERFYRAWHERA